MASRNPACILVLILLLLSAGLIDCATTGTSDTDDDDAVTDDDTHPPPGPGDDDTHPPPGPDDDDSAGDDDTTPVYEPPAGLEIVFYDIGQGDAALIRFPEGSTMLIDGGPNQAGDYVIVPHFWQLGLTFLDVMVVTHPDADHCGGLDDVIEAVAVGELWENGETKPTVTYQEFDAAVNAAGITRRVVNRGDEETIDGCWVQILNADQGWSNPNDNSIVLTISCEGVRVLFTGDITETSQEDLRDIYSPELQAAVVKVPHHGSGDRDPLFAYEVEPEVAVISVGADNPYGHPHPDTVADWQAAGAAVYRTDQDGTVTVSAEDGVAEVATAD